MAEKVAKQKMTSDERRAAVQKARQERIHTAFAGRKFEYVDRVSLEENERYTDVTGNKGRHGHRIRDTKTGEELIVGPASLKKLEQEYKGIKLPTKSPRGRRPKSETESVEV